MIDEQNLTEEDRKKLVQELGKFNFGACFLSFIWGLGNKTFIPLTSLIVAFLPYGKYINYGMFAYYGIKGNAWAYQNRKWKSLDHFITIQRRWAVAGVLTPILIIFIAVALTLPTLIKNVRKNKLEHQTQSSIQTSYDNTQKNTPSAEKMFDLYMQELSPSIKGNWHPPKSAEKNQVIVLFKIGKNGELLHNAVIKSSGIDNFDNAALKAVNLTAPFKPLPSEFKEKSVDINFSFDYNPNKPLN